MKNAFYLVSICIIFLVLSGCSDDVEKAKPAEKEKTIEINNENVDIEEKKEDIEFKEENFSTYSQTYKFSGEIPTEFQVEYIPNIESINIYDPKDSHDSNIDKSKIFIRYFRASDFLTLNTVDILKREKTRVGENEAVRYEIEKKPGVADFPSQPFWRNDKHKLIDIRLNSQSPTFFYVFSRSPELSEETFNQFINSLVFQEN